MRINDFPGKSYAFPWEIIDPNISYLLRVFKVLRTPDNSGNGGGPPDNSGNGWPPKTVDEKLEKLQSVKVFRVWRLRFLILRSLVQGTLEDRSAS